MNQDLHEKIKNLSSQGINKMQIANTLDCSRTTVYNALA
ncbi:helix-turn-helix domain-containing protein [Psychromonas ingrahamii]